MDCQTFSLRSTQFHLIFLHQNCNFQLSSLSQQTNPPLFLEGKSFGGPERVLITKDSRFLLTPVQPTDFQSLKSKLLTLFILLLNCSSPVLSILYYIYIKHQHYYSYEYYLDKFHAYQSQSCQFSQMLLKSILDVKYFCETSRYMNFTNSRQNGNIK